LHSVFKIICLFSLTITSYLFDTFIIQLMLLITQVNLKKTKISYRSNHYYYFFKNNSHTGILSAEQFCVDSFK
jgi:hypothetical protein